MPTYSGDNIQARNSTKVFLKINGVRVGRVQSLRQDITNNVQVLNELGRSFAVELKKGITNYTFSIAKFYARADAFEAIKLGQVFSLAIIDYAGVDDGGGSEDTLEYFERCAIQTISRDYTIGAATVGENATVVAIGQGHTVTV
jgi:hypothetical protein